MHKVSGRRTPLAGLILAVLSAPACVHRSPSATPCAPIRQATVIATRLDRLAPSPAFVVGTRVKVWAATTASSAGTVLFGGASGIATLSVIRDGSQPAVRVDADGVSHSSDPSVVLRQARRWVRLPVSAGTWRVYSADLSVPQLPITAVACPR